MYRASIIEHTLKFRFPAGTSRGILNEKKSWFISLTSETQSGTGECSLIPKLSRDNVPGYVPKLESLCEFINQGNDPAEFNLSDYPSIGFGLETAMKDIENNGSKILFPSAFTEGRSGIPINGLIWMSDPDYMARQVKEKISAGFSCLKLKVGATDFETETELLKNIRREFPNLEIRLDANGAFDTKSALSKLQTLAQFSIHSIEQPIKPGQWEKMADLCMKSPLPVALDEELIGVSEPHLKEMLLDTIKPAYIILKPCLLGGVKASEEWITLAEKCHTDWWITSALESNIGLNAIAQWCFSTGNKRIQGLGTGQLYENNIPSPLRIKSGKLFYDPARAWDLSIITS